MKIRKLLRLFLALNCLWLVAGCNQETPTEQQTTEVAQKQKNLLEDKVVVYSTHSEKMLEIVADAFEKETGVTVEFINLKGELADRVRGEKNNPQGDVMFGGTSSLFMDLKSENAFQAFEPSWASDLSPLFKDKNHYWFGTIQTPIVMFYNTQVISENTAPKDWSDLKNPAYKDKLIFRNALSSSARAMYSAILQQYDRAGKVNEGWAFMKGMDANTKKYYGSGSLMFQALGRQEAGISFATLNSIVDNQVKNHLPLKVIDAESGSPVVTDGIAVIKDCPHPKAAKAFVEFAGGAKMQARFANEFNRMPTLPQAIVQSPAWMSEMTFKVMNVDWADLANHQSEWMQKWDTEIKSTGKDQ